MSQAPIADLICLSVSNPPRALTHHNSWHMSQHNRLSRESFQSDGTKQIINKSVPTTMLTDE
eukprot:2670389-Amphidinium_carterae.1